VVPDTLEVTSVNVYPARGYLPIAYDNLSRGQRAALKWGPLEVGDIDDRDRLRAVLGHHRPTAVMHFAALADVGESVEKPLLYYKNNVAGSIALLETLNEFGPLPFIFHHSA
jgi:UDP-arabinose 4-epimerase